MLKAKHISYVLNFIRPGGTSRGVLHTKETFFIKLWNDVNPSIYGLGEAALFRGLSADDHPDYEKKLSEICENPGFWIQNINKLKNFPSIQFGLETAFEDLQNGGKQVLFNNQFTSGEFGIKINGLIWMGDQEYMLKQIEKKLNEGFSCLKMKISANNFENELKIIQQIRNQFSANTLELRVDANGAFDKKNVYKTLDKLSKLNIHSLEQPIKAGNLNQMAELCKNTPIPIALDEELIGVFEKNRKKALLEIINPQYIILKPALIGGFSGTKQWINFAEKEKIKWWITSALESNIGLNAIAQFTASFNNKMPQGLGTGQVFSNNIKSPLELRGENLFFSNKKWNFSNISELILS